MHTRVLYLSGFDGVVCLCFWIHYKCPPVPVCLGTVVSERLSFGIVAANVQTGVTLYNTVLVISTNRVLISTLLCVHKIT